MAGKTRRWGCGGQPNSVRLKALGGVFTHGSGGWCRLLAGTSAGLSASTPTWGLSAWTNLNFPTAWQLFQEQSVCRNQGGSAQHLYSLVSKVTWCHFHILSPSRQLKGPPRFWGKRGLESRSDCKKTACGVGAIIRAVFRPGSLCCTSSF